MDKSKILVIFLTAIFVGGGIGIIIAYQKKFYVKKNRSILNNIQIGNT